MPQFDSAVLPALLFVVQVTGLVSAFLARASRNATRQRLFAALFMISLVAVCCSIIAAGWRQHPTIWLFGGASMGAMIILAVWEHSATPEDFSGH